MTLPEIDVGYGDLFQMLFEPVRQKLILTGLELKIFNQLYVLKSAEDIAKDLGTHTKNTGLLLDGLASFGLVLKENGEYCNSLKAQNFLVEGSQTYLGQFFMAQHQWMEPALNDLSGLVKEGPPPLPDKSIASEEVWAQMAKITANYQRSGTGQLMAEIVSSLPEFPDFGKMLDLGGGTGLIGIAVTAEHTGMRGVIFDRPAVVEVAEVFIKEYGMDDRIEIIGGDYLKDPIGECYDLILACATLNFAKHDIESLTKKIYNALNPGGVFISFHDGLTHEQTKPEIMVLSWLPISLMGNDLALDQGFIAESMLRSGFKSVHSQTVSTQMGPLDLDIARK